LSKLWWAAIRLGFRLLYNELAWTYDLVSWVVSLGKWRVWQRASLQFLDSSRGRLLLELAHGTANLQVDLASAGWLPVGFDLSRSMGGVAQRKMRRANLVPRLVRGTAERLPFGNETFPYVLSTFPTEFIIHIETIREIYRVLRPHGRLVVVLNAVLTISTPLVLALDGLYRITGQRGPFPENPFHSFRECGFETSLEVSDLPDGLVWILVADKK
jgi:ubiquinone/menaquinone biosynthesis C-methylase UbiE